MSKPQQSHARSTQTFEGEHGRPLTKKNWRSVPVLPQPTANFDIKPRTFTSFALLHTTMRPEYVLRIIKWSQGVPVILGLPEAAEHGRFDLHVEV